MNTLRSQKNMLMVTLLLVSFFVSILTTATVFAQSNTDNNPGNPNAAGYNASTQQTTAPSSYTPIVGIPGIDGGSLSTEEYVRALYYLAITVAALLAVYKIMVAGIKYMFDGVATHKEEAKKDIWGAIFGLLIVLTAVLVLETVNVNLTSLNVLGNAPGLDTIEGGANRARDICVVKAIDPNTGQTICTAKESDVANANLDKLKDPTIANQNPVVAVTQSDQREAVNEGTIEELMQNAREEAALKCGNGVTSETVKETIPLGFVGIQYYCP